MHTHATTYTFGDTVYLRTDQEQLPRIVVTITLKPGSLAYYEVGSGPNSSWHYDHELTSVPDQSLKLGIEVVK